MVIWLLRKVNNVTVVTRKMIRAVWMTNVVKVAVGMSLGKETVSFCQEKHAGWFLFSGRQYTGKTEPVQQMSYRFSKRQRKELCTESLYKYLQRRSQYTSFLMFDRTSQIVRKYSVLKLIYMLLTSVSITICLTPCK